MNQSDKIKELEERIRQLEMRPFYIYVPTQSFMPIQPPWLPWWQHQTTSAVSGPTLTQAGSYTMEVAQ